MTESTAMDKASYIEGLRKLKEKALSCPMDYDARMKQTEEIVDSYLSSGNSKGALVFIESAMGAMGVREND